MTFWNVFFLLFIFIRSPHCGSGRSSTSSTVAISWDDQSTVDLRRNRDSVARHARLSRYPARHRAGSRAAEAMQAAQHKAETHQRHLAGFSVADEISKLEQLRDSGSLTPAEYDRQRQPGSRDRRIVAHPADAAKPAPDGPCGPRMRWRPSLLATLAGIATVIGAEQRGRPVEA